MARHLIQNATTGDARIVGDAALAFFPGYVVVDTYDDGVPPAVFYGAGESDLRYVNVTELSDSASAASVALRAAFDVSLDGRGVTTRMAALNPEQLIADRAPTPLTIPTYDGTGQSAHPSIYYNPIGWGADANGKAWKWWMAHTPLAGADNALENPSISVSDDGLTWIDPPGLTNPITPKPAGSGNYNSDTEITLGPDGLLYCFYRPVVGTTEYLAYKTSANGITWSAEQIALTSLGLTLGFLSPAIEYDPAAKLWRLWAVNGSTDPNRVETRTAATLAGPWSAPVACTLAVPNTPAGVAQDVWHIGVTRHGSQYLALVNSTTVGGSGQNGYNYLAVSTDGVTWTVASKPLTPRGSGGGFNRWDAQPYRGVVVPVDTGTGQTFRVYYSATGTLMGWRIGVTELRADPKTSRRGAEFLPFDDYGAHAWTCDPAQAVGASNTLAAGAITFCLLRMAVTGYIGSLLVQVTTAGAGLTAGQNFIGLYDAAGTLLGTTADLSTVLASTGAKGINLVSPTRLITAGEKIAVAILPNGTTPPKFAALANPVAINAGRVASGTADNGPYRSANVGSALTALPGTLTYGSASPNAWVPWVALQPATSI